MILEMKVPSPGESITEVEIAQWLVEDGDYVEKDQAIAEVDSDKATLELPAEVSGTISLKAEEGDAVAVGQVVCHIDTEGQAKQDRPPVKQPLPLKIQLLLLPLLRILCQPIMQQEQLLQPLKKSLQKKV